MENSLLMDVISFNHPAWSSERLNHVDGRDKPGHNERIGRAGEETTTHDSDPRPTLLSRHHPRYLCGNGRSLLHRFHRSSGLRDHYPAAAVLWRAFRRESG